MAALLLSCFVSLVCGFFSFIVNWRLPFNTTEDIGSKEVFDAAQSGDAAALKAIDQACDMLGLACVNISRLLDTELIVFAGGMFCAKEMLNPHHFTRVW